MKEIKGESQNTTTREMRVVRGDRRDQEDSTGRCLAFADAARQLGPAVRSQGLDMPSFRSPPRQVGRRRTLIRHGDGSATVAVMVQNRLWVSVLADMIEGVVVANQLDGIDAEAMRDELWAALEAESAQREAA
ncbi:hypothetical protein [Candidatus Poriferisocius sp.]|uniref:hypothetical protein n=1 Tax=Candidatus Poriferisocius sp. TaxID=3101276 RepID=UPI003B01D820